MGNCTAADVKSPGSSRPERRTGAAVSAVAEAELVLGRLRRAQDELMAGDLADASRAQELHMLNQKISSVERDKSSIQRELVIGSKFDMIRLAQNVDICFLVDCTGSMGNHIRETKERIQALIDLLKNKFADISVRMAFLGYRDHKDKNQFDILDFTSSVSKFKSFVAGVKATGGGDLPEDVNGGLQKIMKLDWNQKVRVVLHIADAPPHGRIYGDSIDDYPDFHANDLPASYIFKEFQKHDLLYWFGTINHSTDGMIKEFKRHIEVTTANLKVPGDLLKQISEFTNESITNSISAAVVDARGQVDSYLSTTGRTGDKFSIQAGYLPEDVNWDKVEVEQVTIRQFSNLEDLEEIQDNLKLITTHNVDVQLAPYPFAQGTFRIAYAGREFKPGEGTKTKTIVFKEYYQDNKRVNDRTRTVYDMEMQTIAQFLAKRFQEFPVVKKSFQFIPIKMVEFGNRVICDAFSTEDYLPEEKFERISNNGIFQKEGKQYELIHAFSHWTYIYTNKYLLVCDIEGCITQHKLLLTDPAIHCTDVLRFGSTNFGQKGFTMFFSSHKCNKVCQSIIPAKHWR